MTINALKTFGIDLADEELTRTYAGQLPDCADGILEIDFSLCLIDYPGTSIIMDAAFEKLMAVKPPRSFVTIFNAKHHERLFLKWLFFGSLYLGLDGETISDEEILPKIQDGLKKMEVIFSIVILDRSSQSREVAFIYG